MSRLEGRVAVVTGAGRGLGRAHALFLAGQGAKVVVNDLGGDVHGEGIDAVPAEQVVREIRAAGGEAVASAHDVADWDQAGQLIALAIATFGTLHVLVNNAGILRDRSLPNLTERDWDAVIRVHLKGHAAPTHHAMAWWRDRAKAGEAVQASIIHTSSAAGLAGNFGQANYGAAKLAVVALSRIAALEGARYGVRSNAVSPGARTRIALTTPGASEQLKAPDELGAFDPFDPANVSPLIGWLAEASCPATSQIFHVVGNHLFVLAMPPIVHQMETEGRWTPEALDRELASRLVPAPSLEAFFAGLA